LSEPLVAELAKDEEFKKQIIQEVLGAIGPDGNIAPTADQLRASQTFLAEQTQQISAKIPADQIAKEPPATHSGVCLSISV